MDDLSGTGPTANSEVEAEVPVVLVAAKRTSAELKADLLDIKDGLMIRPYRPEDRPVIERICQATGLRSRLDELFCDKKLFVGLWLSPYLDAEPEHCLTLVKDGNEVVGYLVGSVRPGFRARAARYLFPHVLKLAFKWMTGQYRHHPPSGRFAKWILTRSWKEMPVSPEHSANFHFNMEPGLTATLVAERFMLEFEKFIEAAGLPGWHATLFSSTKKRTIGLYKRMGFQIVDQKKCTLFPDGDVMAVTVYKPLSEWVKMARIPMTGGAQKTPKTEQVDEAGDG